MLSSPGTVDNSTHQLGMLHFSTFHCTQLANFDMASSGGVSYPLSSDASDDPCEKEATSALSSGSSPKSDSPPSDPISPSGISESSDQPGVGSIANLTCRCLFLCLSSDLQRSQLLGLPSDQEWTLIQCSFLISSSRVAVVDRAFWCTLHTLARLLSTELSLSQWGLQG